MQKNDEKIIYKMMTKPESFLRFGVSIILLLGYAYFFFFQKETLISLPKAVFLPIWLYFAYEVIRYILPVFNISVACGKHFVKNFKPTEYFKKHKIKGLIKENAKPLVIALMYGGMILILGYLKIKGIFDEYWIYLFVFFFHFSDHFCINVWCPFRTYLKNRCCVTCRIYNWDPIMKFAILLFVPGVFQYSLVALGLIALIQWEILHKQHPERFYQLTNANLTCGNCARNCIRQHWIKDIDKIKNEVNNGCED